MSNWYLFTHNIKATQRIIYKVRALGAEIFSPIKLKVTRRADCHGVRTTEIQLFPGYLFVKLDPEVIHTSQILQIVGVNEFVSFGGKIATISNSLMDAIKVSLIIRPDKSVTNIECRNIPPAVLEKLEKIMQIKSVINRRVELFKMLQAESHILAGDRSTVVFVIYHPYVNDLIN